MFCPPGPPGHQLCLPGPLGWPYPLTPEWHPHLLAIGSSFAPGVLSRNSWTTETKEVAPSSETNTAALLPGLVRPGPVVTVAPCSHLNHLQGHFSLFLKDKACSQLDTSTVSSTESQKSEAFLYFIPSLVLQSKLAVSTGIFPSLFLASAETAD